MEKINVKELNDNVFETIGKEWMLVCAGNKEKFNMMTASWGCLGWLWNKPVAVVFIRPERFTHGIIEENEFMTLSFLGNSEEARKIYNFCGSKSGRDLDIFLFSVERLYASQTDRGHFSQWAHPFSLCFGR